MQKSIIVTGYWDSKGTWKDTTNKLNDLLEEGYRVVSVTPMGAYGFGYGYANSVDSSFSEQGSKDDHGFASLVIIAKDS